MRNPAWQRYELILALDVYFRESYNKLGPTHPMIKELSHILNRLPSYDRVYGPSGNDYIECHHV